MSNGYGKHFPPPSNVWKPVFEIACTLLAQFIAIVTFKELFLLSNNYCTVNNMNFPLYFFLPFSFPPAKYVYIIWCICFFDLLLSYSCLFTCSFVLFLIQGITSTSLKKGELFLADVNTQLKKNNITADVKVDTNSNVSCVLAVFQLLIVVN